MNTLSSQKPILVIDDDDRILFSIEAILRMAGFGKAVTCNDSRQVEDLLSQDIYALVLLDLTMPNISGVEILSLITGRYPNLPVIIITASNKLESAAECLNTGVYDYLLKPVDKYRLLNSVKRALEYQREKNENKLVKDLLLSDRFDSSIPIGKDGDSEKHLHFARKIREEYRQLFSTMLTPFFFLDAADMSILHCNAAFSRFFEASMHKNTLGKTCNFPDFFDERSRNRICKELASKGKIEAFELTGIRENQIPFTILLTCQVFHQEGYVEGSFTDISDKKDLELRLQKTQKMELMWNLVGGVVHDFNNILTAVNGYSELLIMELAPSDAIDSVHQIQKASQRGQDLVQRLLSYSRNQRPPAEKIDLDSAIGDMINMIRILVGKHISVELDIEPELGAVMASPGHIEQIVLNLAVNARDAMPDGGILSIDARTAVGVDRTDADSESFIVITISDTGHGMAEETMQRIFEPLYTTKASGTGIGLATVHQIVEQCGGHFEVESEPSRGTSFRIYLENASSTANRELTLT